MKKYQPSYTEDRLIEMIDKLKEKYLKQRKNIGLKGANQNDYH